MSDYLGDLLTRSFAPAPDVRPRAPSIFEPPAGPAVLDLQPDAGPDFDAAVASPAANRAPAPAQEEATRRPERAVAPPERRAADVAPVRPHRRDPETAPIRKDPEHPPSATEQSSPAAVLPNEPPAVRTAASLAGPLAAPRAQAAARATAPNPDPPSRAGGAIQRSLPAAAAPPALERRAIRGPVSAPELARGGRARPSDAAPAAAGLVIRRIEPARDANPPPAPMPARREAGRHSLASPPPAPPSIQVTIGRVEVRASTPATVPPSRAKKEPAMSLETYLQRRAEGGRR